MSFADAIEPVLDLGGAISFPMNWVIEEASQTYAEGVPVQVNGTDGGLQVWDGTTTTAGIAGFAQQAAQNLGSTGSGAATPFSPILGAGSVIGSYAPNATQSAAVITPPSVPISIGLASYYVALPSTVFVARIGSSSGTPGPVVTTNQQVGVAYGLTKDSGNSFWYVDTNKTGGSAVVRIVGLSPLEAVGTSGGHVFFIVLNAAAQIFA